MTKNRDRIALELEDTQEAHDTWYAKMEKDSWDDYDTVQAEHDGWLKGHIAALEWVLRMGLVPEENHEQDN